MYTGYGAPLSVKAYFRGSANSKKICSFYRELTYLVRKILNLLRTYVQVMPTFLMVANIVEELVS